MPSLVHSSYSSSHSDPSSSKMAPPATPAEENSTGETDILFKNELIDRVTFEQILEMDDDEEEREFSKGIVYGFFEQAEATFDNIEQAINSKNLEEVSQLGHFLKGSSATLGLNKVKESCEKIQHFGAQKDESGTRFEPDQAKCLAKASRVLTDVKQEYKEVSNLLKRFYGAPME
ncbi:hypothetical protein D8B26_007492 [Coccidioides posadasii str. Silveira]|uniref:Uncharacterized protein n=3 Tax=Coccidioides posadasii TaxID=199306 RepID=E9D222_COCPS|nr:Hpt domain containing protein [Coccidioides posadasii C735 delta SOWgp]EER24918.1 Hpt domain containing protein [Coccidioides posadasii C735 delta SOWgp]EFW19236.1 conserved hypothetical protein [Coccidioides posadasii str. Silveira]KMM71701.1 hypothetical protein CPAG_08004 [Coccidioides posadasii RMSCC 3488]QVM12875.1 hypothetical protein D8B26_007492 [Coccidioides posadasii str. Silveira]|eukprot:XP_003067063.1 Hpt domain containing protein [Coccidioides posadasii C735 delta SOWgp]